MKRDDNRWRNNRQQYKRPKLRNNCKLESLKRTNNGKQRKV